MIIRESLAKTLFVLLIAVNNCSLPLHAASTDDTLLLEQRKKYIAAKKALNAGQLSVFKKTTAGLKDYPLYPYLRYDYLKRRLWKVKSNEVIAFLKHYNDLPMANDLRKGNTTGTAEG